MAGKEKKGAKFGRHSRAASNAMQKTRTERNKRLHRERAHKLKMHCRTDLEYGRRATPNDRHAKMIWMLLNRVAPSRLEMVC
jgi:hypothetical protein